MYAPETIVTLDGVTQPIAEHALDYGIPAELIIERIAQGWAIERAITEPMPARRGDKLPARAPYKRLFTCRGRTMTLPEWAAETGIRYNCLWLRLSGGWSVERALTEPPGTYHRERSRRKAAAEEDGPGVVADFAAEPRDRRGSGAHDRPEITFSSCHPQETLAGYVAQVAPMENPTDE